MDSSDVTYGKGSSTVRLSGKADPTPPTSFSRSSLAPTTAASADFCRPIPTSCDAPLHCR